jgi:hypothetical protein
LEHGKIALAKEDRAGGFKMRSRVSRSIRSLLIALALLTMPATALAQVSASITVAPPELPVYDQPVCPGDGYIWVPGYWAWGDDDYYWVPGTWVMAPEVGFLWTPGYWGWGGSSFVFYDGYWGPQVGFYGGIDYGFGYFGHGYEGGRWDNGHFFYNRSVNNVNVTVIHNVYNTTVANDTRVARVSYNGGNGGINERPTSAEDAASRDRHVPPVAAQVQHVQSARSNPQLRASANQGRPPVAATAKPGEFDGGGAVRAREGSGSAAPRTENASRPTAIHPSELPPAERMAAPNTGNAGIDKKYQQQQEKLSAQQNQERQKLQQQQDKEHQQLAKRNADDASKQQVEQLHQQQTQQLVQRHTQQTQQLQQRQQPARPAQSKAPAEEHPQ